MPNPEWDNHGGSDELASLRAKLAEAEKKAEDFKRIGQGFERDMRKHFEQSCTNLQRAEKAEAKLAEWEAAGRKDREDIRVLTDCLLGWNNQFDHYINGDSNTHMSEPVNLSDAMDVIHRRADEARAASRLVAEAGGKHG